MNQIIPAIMAKNFYDLKEKMEMVIPTAKIVQIDVMDGNFVSAKSWPHTREEDADFLKIVNQDEGFPFWEDIEIEADLMVSDPLTESQKWAAAGASRIILHYLSVSNDKLVEILREVKEKGIETGIAFRSKTEQTEVEAFIEENKEVIDFVQCMGINQIGHQGEPFDEKVLNRIKDLRQKFPELVISVDGGVNLDTAEELLEAGANRLVSGSAIYESEVPKQTIKQFEEILNIA